MFSGLKRTFPYACRHLRETYKETLIAYGANLLCLGLGFVVAYALMGVLDGRNGENLVLVRHWLEVLINGSANDADDATELRWPIFCGTLLAVYLGSILLIQRWLPKVRRSRQVTFSLEHISDGNPHSGEAHGGDGHFGGHDGGGFDGGGHGGH